MNHKFLLGALASLVILNVSAPAQAAVLLNFDTASQLDSLDQTSPTSPTLTWSGSAGIGGGGGVTTSADTTDGSFLYSPGTFDATQTGVGFILSYYFQTPEILPGGLGNAVGGIGLGKDASTDIGGAPLTDRITLSVNKWNGSNGWSFINNNSTSNNSSFGNFSMDADTWYKLQGIFTQAANGQWSIQMDLWSYGSDGTGTPVSIASILRGAGVASTYSGVGSSMEASLGILAYGGSRTQAFDQLESNIALVPEPTTVSMALGGLLVGVAFHRRRMRRKRE